MMKTAFLFPGQGSQSVGMLADCAQQPVVKQTFDEASAVLGFDLWQLVQDGPESALNTTDKTQPAMLTAGVALWRLWQQYDGFIPDYIAGHSLGEYSALVCAGVLPFSDTVKLVTARARYMQEAVPAGVGAMAAIIGLDHSQVLQLCQTYRDKEVLAPANYNCPGQVVIAGHKTAVERAVNHAKTFGAKKTVLLPVSVPSHCQLMQDAADQLQHDIAQLTFNRPSIPLVHNFDVNIHDDGEAIKVALLGQLANPVRWTETIEYLSQQGVATFVECGPGKVLTGLNKRINRQAVMTPVYDTRSLETALNWKATSAV